MSEDHIKTVVIDLPPEKLANEQKQEDPRSNRSDEMNSNERKPELPNSWLS